MEHELMTRAEVAKLFRVDGRTVTRWGETGKLHVTRTPGGQRRYFRREVEALYGEGYTPDLQELPSYDRIDHPDRP